MFRLIDLEGSLVAHSAVCPHWLGPLDEAPVIDGAIRCPWHGYVFDVVDGRCQSQPALKLAPPPEVRVIDGCVTAARAF